MTAILGISAFYHDSAAALVVDGHIVAAAQQERFSRQKHDAGFPVDAVQYCLDEGGLSVADLDYVGFYDKPLLTFERLLETYVAFAPSGFSSFLTAMPEWLKRKLHLPRELKRHLGKAYNKRLVFTEHHQSHAASAFFPSPFEQAAILTVDGVGEWATATCGHGAGNRITLTQELRFPHSLGLLYSAFTYYCGFRVNSGEYKLMGLAPYGEPRYTEVILKKLLDLKDDGSFRMDMSYFNYCQGLTMTSHRFHQLFGGPPRQPESPLTQREMDLAASVQQVTEEIMLRMARHLHRQTGLPNLCMAGGVALNCVANGRILREGPFENIWIQPAAGDAGGALGVALFTWHQLLGNGRTCQATDSQQGSYLGPAFGGQEIQQFLDQAGAKFRHYEDEDQLCEDVAELIDGGQVVGWMQGRMEFGPRALGGRSILGDARSSQMQSVMNQKIKFRESFRPFAPSVLAEHTGEIFDLGSEEESPYMLLVTQVCDSQKLSLTEKDKKLHGLDKLQASRSMVPAITHVDGSARVQTVDQRNGRYHKLLKKFQARTSSPVLINTSFNVRGEPIVCTPEQAYQCFMATHIDVLVLEQYVLLKDQQAGTAKQKLADYLDKFTLD
ncbi:MAG: carbamoyltransferase [Pirellulales bacterium]